MYHAQKPGKIRVVFDCSAQYANMSINTKLVSGTDLANQIVGVLLRFRKEHVAFMADIKSMFYQVLVPPHQRSLLRYLWWQESNLSKKVVDYQMCVHIFGGTSSPSCSNFALKKAATDNSDKFGQEAAKTLLRNFYVDDLLKKTKSADEAVSLIKNVVQMCAAGGLKLTKFISNHPDVLSAIPEERALGVLWNTDNDTLCFNIDIMEKSLTRRGLLAMLSSIYDPLGLVSPFLLKGRKTLQELCKDSFQWDHPIPENIKQQWLKYKSNLGKLNSIKIARCFKPKNFGNVKGYTLHRFSDASNTGYGQASYLQVVNEDGKVHCCLLLGKSRVTSLKFVSVPRLELAAAILSVKISQQLKQKLDIEEYISEVEEFFWTDSQMVLNYISNESKWF